MFVRSEVYNELGGFDDNFFAHMEEIDLCWRMQLKGHSVYYCGESSVYHVGGGTLAKNNPRKTYLNFRNNLLMIHKNAGKNRGSILLKRRFFDLIAALKFLITNGKKDASAVIKAHKDFRSMRNAYSTSSSENPHLKRPLTIYRRSILWDYYICSRKKFTSLPKNNSF
jgi:GT2 family glycosyltransferase